MTANLFSPPTEEKTNSLREKGIITDVVYSVFMFIITFELHLKHLKISILNKYSFLQRGNSSGRLFDLPRVNLLVTGRTGIMM